MANYEKNYTYVPQSACRSYTDILRLVHCVALEIGPCWKDMILLMEEILHQLRCSLSHHLQGSYASRWLFGISSIWRNGETHDTANLDLVGFIMADVRCFFFMKVR